MESDDEILKILFPFLSFEDERPSETQTGGSSSKGSQEDFSVERLLDKLLPTVEPKNCPICLEEVSETQAATTGLGCGCKNVFYHLPCFTAFLRSCKISVSCPLCNIVWS